VIPKIILFPAADYDTTESLTVLLKKLQTENAKIIEHTQASNQIIEQLIALLYEKCLL
jgi:hypothetical protein